MLFNIRGEPYYVGELLNPQFQAFVAVRLQDWTGRTPGQNYF